jgi:hypothetical protein
MKHALTLLLLAATLAAPAVRAQETAASPLSTTLTVGYDSRYVLYGYRLSRHLYKADVYLWYPLNDHTSVWGGAWYGYLPDGTYQEVDVYGGIDRTLNDLLTVGLAYSLFNYIEVPFPTSDHVSEFAAHATLASGPASLQLRAQYDTGAEGTLARALGAYNQSVTDRLALRLDAELGYAFDYFIDGNLFNHARIAINAPVQLDATFSMTPFIARSIPLAAIDDFEQYETVYGVSFSAAF